jgi:hypothetical protein
MGLGTEIGEISKLKVQALATSLELLIMRYLGSTCSHQTSLGTAARSRFPSIIGLLYVTRLTIVKYFVVWTISIFHAFLYDSAHVERRTPTHNSIMNRLAPVLYIRSTLASSRADLPATQVSLIVPA